MFKALNNRRLGKKGFTLIELIVVIAIIAILAVILLPRFAGFTDSAREKAAMSDARNLLLIVQKLETEGKLGATDLQVTDINSIEDTKFKGKFTTAYDVDAPDGTFDYESDQKDSTGATITIEVKDYEVIGRK